MRLTGFAAIEFAEKQGLRLKKRPRVGEAARDDLTVAEAAALAADDEEVIYLDVTEAEYANAPPTNFGPDR
jgi:hypothetical protein